MATRYIQEVADDTAFDNECPTLPGVAGIAYQTDVNALSIKNQAGTKVEVPLSAIAGVAAGYKIARGATALDGANPTTVATGLTTVVAFVATLVRNTALSAGTAFVTHATPVGGDVDVYGWVLAGTASAGTETFSWIAIGT
jgi:hypothetical protein